MAEPSTMDRESIKESTKRRAREFLKSLENKLNAELPPPKEMRQSIRRTIAAAKNDPMQKHLRHPESAFLCTYAVPAIFRQMQTVPGIGQNEARQSLLFESHRNMPEFCLDTPDRTQGHPFSKIIGTKPVTIVARWKGGHGSPLTKAWPDFAFRMPFPFKIVFEGKYFQQGGTTRAQTELVNDIYQAFFYRGLPYIAPKKSSSKRLSPAWDYDFACLLAYDASENGNLWRAWDKLDTAVKRGFWGGANVYVMILRGTGNSHPKVTLRATDEAHKSTKITPAATLMTFERLRERIRAKNPTGIAELGEALLSRLKSSNVKTRCFPSTINYGVEVAGDFISILSITATNAWASIPLRAVRALGDERFVRCKQILNRVAEFYRREDEADPTKTTGMGPRLGVLDGKVSELIDAFGEVSEIVKMAVAEVS